ncbi:12072_t:CDS:2 [Cetraspora pellucida]|uniref:12072_t:CDS:1 n=1 Tax=Cetraspora pellucida TaxID=1433469 RepID=A0A9N9FWM7_9GLOM|nr:12072_t:CDS:2 [Cetraspora pellucida]
MLSFSSFKYTTSLIGKNIYFIGSNNFTKFFSLDISYPFVTVNPPLKSLPTKFPNNWSITSVGLNNDNKTIFLFGGDNNHSSVYAIDIKIFDGNDNYSSVYDIDSIITGNLPELRRIGTSSVTNSLGQTFIFGGYRIKNNTFTWYNDTVVLDTVKLSWSIYINAPISRSGHTATLLDDGRILYIGGFDSSFNYVPMDQASFKQALEHHFSIADGSVPNSRSEHSAVLVKKDAKIIICGGFRQDSILPTPSLAILTSEKTFTWVQQMVTGSKPPTLYSHTAILVGDLMVVALGK